MSVHDTAHTFRAFSRAWMPKVPFDKHTHHTNDGVGSGSVCIPFSGASSRLAAHSLARFVSSDHCASGRRRLPSSHSRGIRDACKPHHGMRFNSRVSTRMSQAKYDSHDLIRRRRHFQTCGRREKGNEMKRPNSRHRNSRPGLSSHHITSHWPCALCCCEDLHH